MTHSPNSPNNAVMIDMETLGLERDAIILSIAAVMIDLDSPEAEEEVIYSCDTLELSQPKRYIDMETFKWHLTQPIETIKNNFGKTRDKSLYTELLDFSSIYRNKDIATVWSKGVDFDIAMLEYTLKTLDIPIPWNYKHKRCFRTMGELAVDIGIIEKEELVTTSHTALGDAIQQARVLKKIYLGLRS